MGGTIPEGDELLQRAREEKKRLEELQDNSDAIELARREAASAEEE